MNGAAQVARFSATQRLEKRLDNLELVVVTGLAPEVVKDRARVDAGFQDVATLIATLERALAAEDRKNELSIGNFKHQTLWQRLRWLVRGA